MLANVKAALYLTGHTKWGDNISIYGTTRTMRGIICGCGAGVKTFTDASHVNGTQYLLPGDILLNTNYHTAVNLGVGSKMKNTTNTETAASKIPGTCTVTLKQFLVGAEDPQVKTVQIILNGLGYKGKNGKSLAVDGSLGENTAHAITEFQKDKGMTGINFGTVAEKTWKLLLNAS